MSFTTLRNLCDCVPISVTLLIRAHYLLGGPRHLAALALALAAGAVVVVRDGDLLILLSFQLALVETQGTF